jgi:hypothetical protein
VLSMHRELGHNAWELVSNLLSSSESAMRDRMGEGREAVAWDLAQVSAAGGGAAAPCCWELVADRDRAPLES